VGEWTKSVTGGKGPSRIQNYDQRPKTAGKKGRSTLNLSQFRRKGGTIPVSGGGAKGGMTTPPALKEGEEISAPGGRKKKRSWDKVGCHSLQESNRSRCNLQTNKGYATSPVSVSIEGKSTRPASAGGKRPKKKKVGLS